MSDIINLDSESDEATPTKEDRVIINNFASVTIKYSDYSRLNPEFYLNDNLIDFFLNLFIHKKPHFHAFNSFFYRVLADQGFEKVQKWYKLVDIFKKRYWLIPIAENDHWVLVIIKNVQNLFLDKNPRPCMLLFDSIGLGAINPQKLLENYIKNEWKARKGQDVSVNIPLYLLNLPLQNNIWDCGVFLIEYAELFVSDPSFFTDPLEDYSEIFSYEDLEFSRFKFKNYILQISEGIQPNHLDEVPFALIKEPTEEMMKAYNEVQKLAKSKRRLSSRRTKISF